MKSDIKLISVVGARPNFMKIAPIADAIRAHNANRDKTTINHVMIHTGQHYDHEMSRLFFDELGIPKPQYNLEVGSLSHAWQTAEIMKRIEPILEREKPNYVVVVGDVNSTIAAALVAKKMAIRVIHIEAGLRSFDRTMPEEINRILTDSISDLLFITEKSAEQNLLREGIPNERILFVGNVMVDTLLKHRKRAESSDILERMGIVDTRSRTAEEYAILTLHRPANVDDPSKLSEILEAISGISKQLAVVFPVHPRTALKIGKIPIHSPGKILMTGPLGYLDFIKAMANAKIVLTDSGGIQEESTVLGVPCLTLRDNTERPVTITEGTNRLVGLNKETILREADNIIQHGIADHRIPELWDGMAAQRIVNRISDDYMR